MKVAVAESLESGHSYLQYRSVVSELLHQGKSTGNDQSDVLAHYTLLNETRMNRLDKKMVVPQDIIQKLLSLRKKFIWLVLSEGWCGDSAQLLPVLNKLAVLSHNIELKIVFRDENEHLMKMFLTNGTKSIPKVIIIESETLKVCGSWGPRPKGATELIKSYTRQYGHFDDTAKTELQLWYLHDKGLSTQDELVTLMLHLEQMCPQKP